MQVAFRTDASIQIGTGHVMRCLTLADALREQGARCRFICRSHAGHLLNLIEQRGHTAIALPESNIGFKASATPAHAPWLGTYWASDAEQTQLALGLQIVDWLVVDHYALDSRWEQAMRPICSRLMVIDDLADRPHDCDLLLDQNLGRSVEDYEDLISTQTRMLIGPQYALLRPDFAQWREYSLARRVNPRIKSLLVTMGGVDKDNATGRVLTALKTRELSSELRLTVVLGPHAPWLAKVREQAAEMPWPTQVLAGVTNMAELIAGSDLAIGAAGSSSWERCCLGLPTIQLILADNQNEAARAISNSNAAISLIKSGSLWEIILQLGQEQLEQMAISASSICDGQGTLRITTELRN